MRFRFLIQSVCCVWLLGLATEAFPAAWTAMDWIDGWYETSTPSWQQQLGVTQTTISCKVSIRNTPATCISFITADPYPQIKTYVPYIAPDPSTLQANALKFSSLTSGVSSVPEIDLDDFFDAYQTWFGSMSNPSQFLNQVITNFKKTNHNLKFGITLYEDELDPSHNPYIDNTHLPPAVRARFDVIRLFLHYRKNGPNYSSYVSQAKTAFPNAQIVAGLYSYDRIDYWPCAQGDSKKTPCTQSEEISNFQTALNIQVQLLKQGTVVSLDIFPGYFGDEGNLYGTGPNSDNLTCKNVSRCVQNTITMRSAILSAHNNYQGSGNAPTITEQPTNTNLIVGQTQIFSIAASGATPMSYEWQRNGSTIAGATSPNYHTPAVTMLDNNSQYRCFVRNAYGTRSSNAGLMTVVAGAPALSFSAPVQVFPNPWRRDRHLGQSITFNHLGVGTAVEIFTVSTRMVKRLTAAADSVQWDRTNESGEDVASGLYTYLATNGQGEMVHGTLAIIH